MTNAAKMGILEKLAQGPVLGDGGYLLELEKRGRVRAGPFTPEVALENPEALLELHREFRVELIHRYLLRAQDSHHVLQ